MYNSWVEISKSAILHNLKSFQRIVGNHVEIMPVIKSNAYGHGMIEVAKLVSPKIKWLGVASLGEALELRKNKVNKEILVLSYAQSSFLNEGIKNNISLPVYDLAYAKFISASAGKIKKLAKIHIKVDTGATRVGVLSKEAFRFIQLVKALPNLRVQGIYSHFASSEEHEAYTTHQLKNFKQVIHQIEYKVPYIHMGCSAATLVKPEAHFNMIRLGLSLYGLWPSEHAKKIAVKAYPWLKLKPALTWKTKIIQVKDLPSGTKIGYGGTYTTQKQTKMAVIAVGYWEGYDRHLSNKGEVLIKGIKCKILGRVSMNISMVDVSKVKNVKTGDEVILLGRGVTAEELAGKIGTINYEVVTRINSELPRIFVK